MCTCRRPCASCGASFKFDGLMDSLEETLEFFSPEGKPLRASLALSLSQQSIEFSFAETNGEGGAASTGATAGTPGTTPMEEAPAGSNFQDIADERGW